MFKALSSPQRLRIFLKLVDRSCPSRCDSTDEGMCRCVGDLARDLGVASSTVSHHLKELRQAGLMCVARRGQKIECWICESSLELLTAFFNEAAEDHARAGERQDRVDGHSSAEAGGG